MTYYFISGFQLIPTKLLILKIFISTLLLAFTMLVYLPLSHFISDSFLIPKYFVLFSSKSSPKTF